MNRWHSGEIEGYPIEVFLSDDFSLDYWIPHDVSPPQSVIEACERIRASRARSLKGAQRVLTACGWSNA